MDQCPFCKTAVPEQLTAHGGRCPRCFAHIPGAEAPTDPGLAPLRAPPTSDRKRLVRVAGVSFAFGVVVLAALVAAVGRRSETALLDFDAIDYPMPAVVAAPVTVPQRDVPPARVGAGTSGPATFGDLLADGSTGGEALAFRRAPEVDAAGPRTFDWTPPAPAEVGKVDVSMDGPTVSRLGVSVLSDPGAIRAMVAQRMSELVPALQVCYDRRLKVMPNLQGKWRLSFTIDPSGRAIGVDARGVETADDALEDCIARHVSEHWRFSPIAAPQPVARTLRFDRR